MKASPVVAALGLAPLLAQGLTVAAAVAVAMAPIHVAAQPASPPNPYRATRAELEAQLQRLESELPAAKGESRRRALQGEIVSVQDRLAQGDFKAGDQIVVTVLWDSSFSDTATVREGQIVSIRSLPDASLRGVLRSELSDHMTAHVSRFLKNVEVRVNVFARVSVVGEVPRSGFFLISPDRPINELIMAAGGPTPLSKLDAMEVRRAGRVVLSSRQARNALREGRTLEELDIRSGDEVTIPRKRRINWQQITQLLFIASSLLFAYFRFLEWYYREE
jgi:protein involved in polysaccharide export with SLBB domain